MEQKKVVGNPERLRVQIGTLEIIAEPPPSRPGSCYVAPSRTKIRLNGQELAVRRVVVRGEEDSVWEVELDFYPEWSVADPAVIVEAPREAADDHP